MSIQDELRGMLYSGNNVNFLNSAIYLSAPKKKKIELKENETDPKAVDPAGVVTPYNAKAFFKLWDSKEEKIIEGLEKKIPMSFDYILHDDHSIVAYMKPKGTSKKIKSTKLLGYNPVAQIRIIPIEDKVDNVVRKITVQTRYNTYGDNFNKRTINISAPDYSVEELIKEITDTAYSLTKALNLI